MRSSMSMAKLSTCADSALAAANTVNAINNMRLRLNCDANSTNSGPSSAMVKAKIPTSQPACAVEMPYRAMISGKMPTTPNSMQ
ncbi:Uncharacterised protein [Serratia marcescens]|nr:Uncharacterised protein [Serratia marcescens]